MHEANANATTHASTGIENWGGAMRGDAWVITSAKGGLEGAQR
jgi:hypothetical protein